MRTDRTIENSLSHRAQSVNYSFQTFLTFPTSDRGTALVVVPAATSEVDFHEVYMIRETFLARSTHFLRSKRSFEIRHDSGTAGRETGAFVNDDMINSIAISVHYHASPLSQSSYICQLMFEQHNH